MDFGRARNLNRIDWSFAPAPLVANAYPLDVAPARRGPGALANEFLCRAQVEVMSVIEGCVLSPKVPPLIATSKRSTHKADAQSYASSELRRGNSAAKNNVFLPAASPLLFRRRRPDLQTGA